MEILLLEHSTLGRSAVPGPAGQDDEVLSHLLAGRFTQALQSPSIQALLGAHDQPEIDSPEGYFRSVEHFRGDQRLKNDARADVEQIMEAAILGIYQ